MDRFYGGAIFAFKGAAERFYRTSKGQYLPLRGRRENLVAEL
jgi:hypothetical protein